MGSAGHTIDILIIGAGLGGLFCALELKRRGFAPIVLESRDAVQTVGDFITIGPSAIRAFEKWPVLYERFCKEAYDSKLYYHKKTGEIGAGPRSVNETFGRNILRPALHKMLMDTVLENGIEVRYQHHVDEFIDTEDKGGVKLSNGDVLYADLVIAADGIRSKSWAVVTGKEPQTYSSGSAIFRAAYPTSEAMKNPMLRENWDPAVHGETMHFFIGTTSHGIMLIGKEKVCWGWMHRDEEGTSMESWSARLSPETALDKIDRDGEWSPQYRACVAGTPANSIIHWRLVWRDLNKDWVSQSGRVVQLGDAAHAFLPTSVNGGTQAIEDGVSLACCLRMAVDRQGTDGILTAAKVHNTLRLDRVSYAQQLGFKRRRLYYNLDWEAVKEDERLVSNEPAPWQYEHNPETYVIANFDDCRNYLKRGKVFRNNNIPEHYQFEPWTIKDLEEAEAKENSQVNGVKST